MRLRRNVCLVPVFARSVRTHDEPRPSFCVCALEIQPQGKLHRAGSADLEQRIQLAWNEEGAETVGQHSRCDAEPGTGNRTA